MSVSCLSNIVCPYLSWCLTMSLCFKTTSWAYDQSLCTVAQAPRPDINWPLELQFVKSILTCFDLSQPYRKLLERHVEKNQCNGFHKCLTCSLTPSDSHLHWHLGLDPSRLSQAPGTEKRNSVKDMTVSGREKFYDIWTFGIYVDAFFAWSIAALIISLSLL